MYSMIARVLFLSAMAVCLVNSGDIPFGFAADQVKGNSSLESSSAAFDPAKAGARVGDEMGKIMKEIALEELLGSPSHNRRNSIAQMEERMNKLLESLSRSLANASKDDERTVALHYSGHLIPHLESILEDIRKQIAMESNAQRKRQLRVAEDNLQDYMTEVKNSPGSPRGKRPAPLNRVQGPR